MDLPTLLPCRECIRLHPLNGIPHRCYSRHRNQTITSAFVFPAEIPFRTIQIAMKAHRAGAPEHDPTFNEFWPKIKHLSNHKSSAKLVSKIVDNRFIIKQTMTTKIDIAKTRLHRAVIPIESDNPFHHHDQSLIYFNLIKDVTQTMQCHTSVSTGLRYLAACLLQKAETNVTHLNEEEIIMSPLYRCYKCATEAEMAAKIWGISNLEAGTCELVITLWKDLGSGRIDQEESWTTIGNLYSSDRMYEDYLPDHNHRLSIKEAFEGAEHGNEHTLHMSLPVMHGDHAVLVREYLRWRKNELAYEIDLSPDRIDSDSEFDSNDDDTDDEEDTCEDSNNDEDSEDVEDDDGEGEEDDD